eukprot:6177633-Pleurochrysis_carterae.AAC.1
MCHPRNRRARSHTAADSPPGRQRALTQRSCPRRDAIGSRAHHARGPQSARRSLALTTQCRLPAQCCVQHTQPPG